MDYRDKLAGLDHRYFTNRAKLCLVDSLFEKIYKKEKFSILSVGCGDGHELEVLNKYGSVDVLDVNEQAVKLAPRELYSTAYIDDLCEFKSKKKYDVVVGLDVLEHIKDGKKAVECIHSLLREGGYFVLTVPAHQILFSAHDRALNHFRRYSKKELKDLIESKFEVLFLSYRYFFLFLPVVASKIINRDTKPRIEAPQLPGFLNYILFLLCRIEISIMNIGITLPFGISLVCICKKR